MTQPVLDIHNARVFRGNTRVFDEFSLQLHKGENTVILGPNGAGKSTLLKLITRELLPVVSDNSYCRVFGEERMPIWELRQKIGVVSQDFQNNYLALATGLDVVLSAFFGSVGIHGHHQVTEVQVQQARQQLVDLELADLADRQYLQLSTGQQRRLLLARALIHTPAALIFDEPTSGLDLKAAFRIIEDMQALAASGTTLIVVTHHIHEIVPDIQRVIFLKNGRIHADGSKQALLQAETLSDLYDTSLQLSEQRGFYQAFPATS